MPACSMRSAKWSSRAWFTWPYCLRRLAITREPPAELESPTREHQIDDRQCRPAIDEELTGERWVECHADVVALGPQEVPEQLGCVAIAFREQDDERDCFRIGTTQTARPVKPSGEQPVSFL